MPGDMTGKRGVVEPHTSQDASEHYVKRQRALSCETADDTCDTCDLVLVGDFYDFPKEWRGEKDAKHLAISQSTPTIHAPAVRVFAVGNVTGSKYWEHIGTDDYLTRVSEDAWLPQIVANELHERIISEGEESVPRGEFIEEALNDSGESILVSYVIVMYAILSYAVLSYATHCNCMS
jgi:hypothetical protein